MATGGPKATWAICTDGFCRKSYEPYIYFLCFIFVSSFSPFSLSMYIYVFFFSFLPLFSLFILVYFFPLLTFSWYPSFFPSPHSLSLQVILSFFPSSLSYLLFLSFLLQFSLHYLHSPTFSGYRTLPFFLLSLILYPTPTPLLLFCTLYLYFSLPLHLSISSISFYLTLLALIPLHHISFVIM